jgi:uncharacterized protein
MKHQPRPTIPQRRTFDSVSPASRPQVGSAARDEMRTDSDVDLLIEFEAGHSPSLAGFARLKQELEATLGVASIDLATPAILRNPYRRQAILGDLQRLYAA